MKKQNPLQPISIVAIILIFLLMACQGETVPTANQPAEPVAAEPTSAGPVEPMATLVETVDTEMADEQTVEPVEAGTVVAPVETIEAESVEDQPSRSWVSSDVSIPASDGLEIAGTVTLPETDEPVPTVLLLHMLGGSQSDWSAGELLNELHDRGYATLAIDMRGHGATGGRQDWGLAETDLQIVWQYLRDLPQVDPQATAVIGASIGANMALRLAANVPQIDTAVLLSPGLDYRGVTTDDALANYGERPVFYAASADDQYAADSVGALFGQTPGPKQAEIFDGSAHGTQMLTAVPEISSLVGDWLDAHVETGGPELSAAGAGQSVNIQRPDGIHLPGTLFGSASQVVVFANMNDNNAAPWTETAELLAGAGYMALTFNYRSDGNAFIDERDDDLLAAVQYAIDQGAQEIVVVGASIGGPATLKALSAHPELPVSGLIIIAAPTDLGGDEITAEELAAIKAPQLYMTAEDDSHGLNVTVERLFEMAPEPKTWQTVPGSAHGTQIFGTEEGPLLQAAIVDFVMANMPQ